MLFSISLTDVGTSCITGKNLYDRLLPISAKHATETDYGFPNMVPTYLSGIVDWKGQSCGHVTRQTDYSVVGLLFMQSRLPCRVEAVLVYNSLLLIYIALFVRFNEKASVDNNKKLNCNSTVLVLPSNTAVFGASQRQAAPFEGEWSCRLEIYKS